MYSGRDKYWLYDTLIKNSDFFIVYSYSVYSLLNRIYTDIVPIGLVALEYSCSVWLLFALSISNRSWNVIL